MKNAFSFMSRDLFVLEIFTILFWHFGYVEKRLDKKAMVNFKIYDVRDWTTNNYNTCVMRWVIWYHLYNLKNMKNTDGGVLILVKLQAKAYNFIKINTPTWVFSTFFELYKWYLIAQRTAYYPIFREIEAISQWNLVS